MSSTARTVSNLPVDNSGFCALNRISDNNNFIDNFNQFFVFLNCYVFYANMFTPKCKYVYEMFSSSKNRILWGQCAVYKAFEDTGRIILQKHDANSLKRYQTLWCVYLIMFLREIKTRKRFCSSFDVRMNFLHWNESTNEQNRPLSATHKISNGRNN